MKILITGAGGMLATEFAKQWRDRHELVELGFAALDLARLADVRAAEELIRDGLAALENGHGEDVPATLLRQAILRLEEALGARLVPDESAERLLDRVFSRFCIGK